MFLSFVLSLLLVGFVFVIVWVFVGFVSGTARFCLGFSTLFLTIVIWFGLVVC